MAWRRDGIAAGDSVFSAWLGPSFGIFIAPFAPAYSFAAPGRPSQKQLWRPARADVTKCVRVPRSPAGARHEISVLLRARSADRRSCRLARFCTRVAVRRPEPARPDDS